ncbi:diguanylate cyclase/phosphodiesterase with PAS/PAC sensor [Halorhodospira halochloris]|uniref:histidine kinase n=1 Tax=Halorhodospira halochloris TaxID=1052 RepID=A0A0X8XAU5_HALHR|nr:PAS domain S-box protein [Halorhodospira halochloris]MBK1651778.1 hypothetical protein [Halorhodospira halochloris]BAU58650.1 diguanylate cyclase/phosphodiesterase with PAS/PAC sensor [Halorhodospira halochloris]
MDPHLTPSWDDAMDAMGHPIFLHDQDYRILRANSAYLQEAGATLEEVIGHPYWHFFPCGEGPLPGCQSAMAKVSAEKRDVYDTGCSEIAEEFSVPDGRTFLSRSYVARDGQGAYRYSVHILEDITDRRYLEQAHQAAEAKFQAITTAALDAIVLIDAEDRLVYCNPAFEKLLGYRAEELEGVPFHDRFVPERHRAAMQAGMRYFRESGGKTRVGEHTEVEAVHRDGHEIPLELSLAPVQIAGRWHAAGILRDISERQALEKVREQLANLTAQLPGFIYQCQLWPDGRHAFVYANGGVEDTYGVTPQTVLECPDRVFELMYEADRDEVNRSMERSAKTLTPWRQSFRIHHPSKGTVWLEGNSTPERQADGSTLWHGYLHDITERRRAEQAEQQLREQLEARKHDLEAIFAAAESVSLIKTDLNSVILEASTGAEALFGYSREELIGRHVSLLHTDADSERLPGYVDPLCHEHQPARMETELVRRDGSRFPALLTIHPITNSRGELVEMLGVSFDISDQKRAAQDLAEAVAAKTTFLNAVGHDLRTPLNALTGFVELLATSDLEEEQRQSYVQQCRHASRRLLELIDSLLDLGRLQSGRLKLQPAPFDLHAAIESQCTVHRHLAEEHGLQFTSEIEPGVPQWVEADATRLGQILSNLLGNAIKYTNEGQVDLTVSAGHGEWISFRVRDTGPGISPEDQEHIFAAFDRAGYRGSRSGHGLGLAIVRELTELFGGEVSLQSAPGVGSTFSVTLPLPPVAAPEATQNADSGCGRASLPLSGDAPASTLNVLVADDETVNVFLARTLLEQLGCTVTTAEDGAGALEAWQTRTFDALIIDRNMPGFDGEELAERIRSEERAQGHTRVPIALYTAYARSEVESVIEAGLFDAFLSKPLDRAELRQWIESLAPRRPSDTATTPGETHGSTSSS